MSEGCGQNNGGSAHCLLWHAPGTPVPEELLDSLARRGVEVERCTSAFAAMGIVCRHERGPGLSGASEKSAPEKTPPGPLILLLVFPESLPRAAEVVVALKRYAPRSACWCYEPGANQALRAVVESDMGRWSKVNPLNGHPGASYPKDTRENARTRALFPKLGLRLRTQDEGRDEDGSDNSRARAEIWAGPGFGLGTNDPVVARVRPGALTPTGDIHETHLGPTLSNRQTPAARVVNPDAAPKPAPVSGLLTDEELAMLLRDDCLPEELETLDGSDG